MKVWTKVRLKDYDKSVNTVSKSLTNYIYTYGPIEDLAKKYKIDDDDLRLIKQFSANRVAGLLMLYLAKDKDRINDIVNKYNVNDELVSEIIPEIEGYINKNN